MKKLIALILIVAILFTLTISTAMAATFGDYLSAGFSVFMNAAMDLYVGGSKPNYNVYHGPVMCLN